ncbi:beta-lactamase/transpeptidase-like protein [Xylariaceae sp. FL0255]|nr:beta-lactamase/transpeptidase-like protein [Xylariaceae sp. FL0255]
MSFSTSSSRLQNLGPEISELLRISGAVGASIGIIDGCTGERHLGHFGYRDVEKELIPDEYTVYHIASLTKSVTAAAIAILVAEGKLRFEDHMCDVLPGFHHFSSNIKYQSTVLVFLSHRTGLGSSDSLWQQDHQELLLSEETTF